VAAEDYRELSFDVWQQMAEGWDRDRRWIWDSSRAVSEWMLGALDPQAGETILELAAGTGETGFAAASALGERGRLISTDFAPKMVEAARSESERLGLTNVDHRQLDAQEMDLEDDSVDGVLCRWGYMLTADPQAALRETRRGIFAMAHPDRTRSLLEGAGFDVRRMENVEMTWRLDDLDAYWFFLTRQVGMLAVTIAALAEGDQRALRGRLQEAVEPYRTNGRYALPGVTQNTLAA
jgi:SAM-dependent methyltransferase